MKQSLKLSLIVTSIFTSVFFSIAEESEKPSKCCPDKVWDQALRDSQVVEVPQLQPQISWARQFGTEKDDFAKSIGIDREENLYIGGWSNGEFAAESAGGYDIILMKMDSSGKRLWTTQLGSEADEQIEEVATDPKGNTAVVGFTKGDLKGTFVGGEIDAFVAQFDASGNLSWMHQIGFSKKDTALFVEQDIEGNVFVVGHTAGDLFGKNLGKRDVFVAKYDLKGTVVWQTQFGTAQTDIGQGLSFGKNGEIYVSGVTGGYWDEPQEHQVDVLLAKLDSQGTVI